MPFSLNRKLTKQSAKDLLTPNDGHPELAARVPMRLREVVLNCWNLKEQWHFLRPRKVTL